MTGTVTLDDQPLANANIEFQPTEGRPSIGKTDENGKYELAYTIKVKGAKVGTHSVKISTFDEDETEDGEAKLTEEKVPAVYNTETTLSEEVKPGSQEIDFKLDSNAGPIVQPNNAVQGDPESPSC